MNLYLCLGCLATVAVLVGASGSHELQFALESQTIGDQLGRFDRGCGTRRGCERAGGTCQSLEETCFGELRKGRKYCKSSKCGCCIPILFPLTTIPPVDVCALIDGFWIAFNRDSCPCPYFGAVPTKIARPGAICCQHSDCPNRNFTNMHVCGRHIFRPIEPPPSSSCQNSGDALNFAQMAWRFPADIRYPYVFSCQGISYERQKESCYTDLVQTWECQIEREVWNGNVTGTVTSCRDIGQCSVGSFAGDGTIIDPPRCMV